jgi:hypothetical protein
MPVPVIPDVPVPLVSDGGTATIAVTASSSAAVKTSPGRLCKIITTSTATAALAVYDNTNAASGTIIGYVPASTAVGTTFSPQMPATKGIYVNGAAGTPAVTISYI